MFTGVREDPFFQTGQRNIEVLRRCPTPAVSQSTDAEREQLENGIGWLESATGTVTAQLSIQQSMKEGHIRVPHGWWYPETWVKKIGRGLVSSDAVLCSDDDEFLDYEQGVPHFKGFPGRIIKTTHPQLCLWTWER